MAIFCPSCGTIYGGWEFCPECNADNPYLDRQDDPAQIPVTKKVEGGVSSGENKAQKAADKVKTHPYFQPKGKKR
jgi:hypothetical protein